MSNYDPVLLPADEPPTSGEWLDPHDLLQAPTDEEIAEGIRQGLEIDTEDDLDNGFQLDWWNLGDPGGPRRRGAAPSSQTTALQKAQGLRSSLLAHGVPEVSIELVIGRPQSLADSNWDSLLCKVNFGHHTVSSYSAARLTPCLSLVKTGRTGIPGPLCNGYGGWDLTARIICFGYANHPGEGGPFTIHGYTIPKDSARRYAFGWEFEGGVSAADWNRVLVNPRNGKRMTFHEFMARCGAGTQDYFNLADDAHLEHKTWAPTRKIDRLNYTRSSAVALINKYRGSKPPTPPATEEISMSAESNIIKQVNNVSRHLQENTRQHMEAQRDYLDAKFAAADAQRAKDVAADEADEARLDAALAEANRKVTEASQKLDALLAQAPTDPPEEPEEPGLPKA